MLNGNAPRKQTKCAQAIMQKVCDLIKKTKLSIFDGPFSLRELEPVCQLNKIQLVVFSKVYGSTVVYEYPKHVELKWQKVFLYESTPLNSTESHVDCIFSAPGQSKRQQFSLCCHSLINGNISKHRCSIKNYHRICDRCSKILLKDSEYFNYKYSSQFCTRNKSNINKMEREMCDSCGVTFNDSLCKESHENIKNCGDSYVCPTCELKITARKRKANSKSRESPLEKRRKKHQ